MDQERDSGDELVMEKMFNLKDRGWCDSILFWPRNTIFKVVAIQKFVYRIGKLQLAKASVRILEDGNEVFFDEIPWDMPAGETTLLKQVDLHSKNSNFEYPKWRLLMQEFCQSFPDFRPLDKNYLANTCL
jgi:hypothetical protein